MPLASDKYIRTCDCGPTITLTKSTKAETCQLPARNDKAGSLYGNFGLLCLSQASDIHDFVYSKGLKGVILPSKLKENPSLSLKHIARVYRYVFSTYHT